MIIDGHELSMFEHKTDVNLWLSQLQRGLLVYGHINRLAVQLTAIKGLLGLPARWVYRRKVRIPQRQLPTHQLVVEKTLWKI